MQTQLVLTLIAPNRPGLVERVAELVLAHEANWEASRLTHLAGRFAGVVLVTVAEQRAAALEQELDGLASEGLQVIVERAAPAVPAAEPRTLRLEIVGQDRPGIMREVSRAIARHGVSVEDLHTERTSAPMTGEPLFTAHAVLHSSADTAVDTMRETLERIAHDLMVDIELDED